MADDPRMSELRSMALAAMERWRVPGLAVGVLANGAVSTFAGGVASLETGQPATPETLFQIGSISKVFSTTVLMTLVDEGKVDLDAPISRYLPDLELSAPDLADRITVRHLVTHQSGIWGDYFDDFGWGDDALARAVANIKSLRQTYAPGELWSYCNAGFEISGLIMERVSGQSYEALARERLFKPLGLQHTFFFPHEVFAYPHAVGHTEEVPQSGDFSVTREYWLSRALSPVGSILSTVADLLAFARFHMGDGTVDGQRVLSEASTEAMRTPQVKANNLGREWGLGWSIDTLDGVRLLWHTGGTNGFTALLVAVPARQFALAVLTNSSSGPSAFREIRNWALEHFAGLKTPERPTVPLAGEQLERLLGTYRSPRTEITVTRDGDGLSLSQRSLKLETGEPVTLPPIRVRPIGEWDFAGVEGRNLGLELDFIPGPNGAIRFLRFGSRLHDRIDG